MITRNGVDSFAELPADEQARVRVVGREMVRLAETHAVPIVFGAPAWQRGKFNSASGCLVKVGARTFVVSAAHVLDAFEAERRAADQVIWQVGNFGFDPSGRVAWQDKKLDIVLFELAQSEIARVGSHALSVPPEWPPPKPQVGQFALVSGFPLPLRDRTPTGVIRSGAASAMLPVSAVGNGYAYCQFLREHLISFGDEPVPPADLDYGGWSGGPVFLVGDLAYPLVGIVSQFQGTYEILRIALLNSVNLPA